MKVVCSIRLLNCNLIVYNPCNFFVSYTIIFFPSSRYKTPQSRETLRRKHRAVRHAAGRASVLRRGEYPGAARRCRAQRYQLRSRFRLRRLGPVDRVTRVTSRLAPPRACAAAPPARPRAPRRAPCASRRRARRHHAQARARRPSSHARAPAAPSRR